MPLFDWSATSASTIMTGRFWVYWAMTIPLTLVTMIIVSVWIVLQTRKNEAISKATRDALNRMMNIK